MNKFKIWLIVTSVVLLLIFTAIGAYFRYCTHFRFTVGQPIDSLNGVYVYYNGRVGNISGRNKTADGYNLGLKYQCVEFVKRYYFRHLNHRMPDTYGDAIDFFDKAVEDGSLNTKRNLLQFHNPGKVPPQADDLLVYSGTSANPYGHVSIVSKVTDDEIEIIQQNPGKYSKSRKTFSVSRKGDKWLIENNRILGWLRKNH